MNFSLDKSIIGITGAWILEKNRPKTNIKAESNF
tara:strand:- start:5714 stop:5815 length:102 start_codon:yes stop_codon:yes gene_type:complete